MMKAVATPALATISPPSAGPTLRAKLKLTLLRMVAAGMSCRGTMSPTDDCHAGLFSAVPQPIRNVKVRRSQGPIRSNQAMTASRVETANMKPCAISRIRRRSQLSEIAPATSENSMTGSVVEACTRATMSGEAAIVVISQEAATPWISAPKFETSVAIQSARKTGCRNGTNGEAESGGAAPFGRSSASATSSTVRVSRSPGMSKR